MYVHPATDALPGEPVRVRAATGPFLLALLLRAIRVVISVTLSLPFWPLFLITVAAWGWPPHLARPSQVARYLTHAWRETPPEPGIAPLSRVWLILRIVEQTSWLAVHGVAWAIDEVLYGRQLDATPVVAPLILLSAARSGSTQLSHYLEDDPHLISPITLRAAMPYRWVWVLVEATAARFVSAAWVRARYDAGLPQEMRERHEGDPFRTDTFEVLYSGHQLNRMAGLLGPRVMSEDMVIASSAPHNRQVWDHDFVDFIDRLARKTLLHAGPAPDGRPRRFFFKGHFLEAADALSRRYPDARFLTVIREPLGRMQSMLNHLHGNPFGEELGAWPWAWLTQTFVPAEIVYCQWEQRWFTAPEGPRRTVVRFKDYVTDLEGTMRRVYRECLDEAELPPHVPIVHAERERKNYCVNRSLDQLGVDSAAIRSQLADYVAWCKPPRA